jgi:Zn-finger nucleic acid-binding protein
MNCANCGAPARLDLERGLIVCDYCRTETTPPIGEDGVQVLVQTGMQCPACENALAEGRAGEFELLYCTACRGMLVPMADFMPLVANLRLYRAGPAAVLPRDPEHGIKLPRICPRCQSPMDHHPYGGGGNVFLDTCEACSANWLDKGELQRIVAAPDPVVQYAPLYSEYGRAGEFDRQDD